MIFYRPTDGDAHTALPAEVDAKLQGLPWDALEDTVQVAPLLLSGGAALLLLL